LCHLSADCVTPVLADWRSDDLAVLVAVLAAAPFGFYGLCRCAFLARFAGFLAVVGEVTAAGLTALAGDFALLFFVHAGEAAIAGVCHIASLSLKLILPSQHKRVGQSAL